MGGGASAALDPDAVPAQYLPEGGFAEEPFHVYLELSIDGEAAGKIVANLRADICPMACENFRLLCTGEKGPCYKGSIFNLYVPGPARRRGTAPPLSGVTYIHSAAQHARVWPRATLPVLFYFCAQASDVARDPRTQPPFLLLVRAAWTLATRRWAV